MDINRILYPLRQLHGFIADRQRRHELHKYLSGAKVCILGTPTHKNVGDCAIAAAQQLFLQKCGFEETSIKEITLEEYNCYRKCLRQWISNEILITQIGGGNLGNQWMNEEELHRKITKDFADNPMIIFPQTIYFTDDENGCIEKQKSVSIYNKIGSFALFAREEKSYEIMKDLYPKAQIHVAPDIVLTTKMEDYGVKKQLRKGALLCIRSDVERSLTTHDVDLIKKLLESRNFSIKLSDMYSEHSVSKENRKQIVREKMEEFSSAELVITDRLHGMVFSAITGTPCIVLSNYNHKVSGTYEWIRYLPYIHFAESIEKVDNFLTEISFANSYNFDNSPLLPYFNTLARMVKFYGRGLDAQ